jgi:hypothetical protein
LVRYFGLAGDSAKSAPTLRPMTVTARRWLESNGILPDHCLPCQDMASERACVVNLTSLPEIGRPNYHSAVLLRGLQI